MTDILAQSDKTTYLLRRIARIWSGVIITLGALIFLGEIIEASTTQLDPYPWWEDLIPFTLFLSIVSLIYAWKDECLGGAAAIGFVVLNLLLYIFTGRTKIGTVALILSPIAIPSALFLLCWWRSKQISP